jgi:hypothetical protein
MLLEEVQTNSTIRHMHKMIRAAYIMLNSSTTQSVSSTLSNTIIRIFLVEVIPNTQQLTWIYAFSKQLHIQVFSTHLVGCIHKNIFLTDLTTHRSTICSRIDSEYSVTAPKIRNIC